MSSEKIEKALKLFAYGKKHIDKTTSKKYFKKTLDILSQIKNKNELLINTEKECKKIIHGNNIFDLISENEIEKIKTNSKINFNEFNIEGNTILHHTIKIGDNEILKELLKKGGSIDQVNGNGHTLLDYACINNYTNSIEFLINHGVSMEKHLYFRTKYKVYLNKSDVDLAILMKILLYKSKNTHKLKLFTFLEKYINIHELIGINDLKIKDLLFGLEILFNGKNRFNTYKDILIEELEDFIKYKDSLCSYKMIDILLINLVPFINYPFNLSCDFIIKSELKFLINSLIKTNKNNYKNILVNKIYKDYIENKLFTEDYIGVQIYKILKFKK